MRHRITDRHTHTNGRTDGAGVRSYCNTLWVGNYSQCQCNQTGILYVHIIYTWVGHIHIYLYAQLITSAYHVPTYT